MSKYEKMNELDEAYERYLKATAVKDAFTKLRNEHKDNFDEHANLVIGAALMEALEEFGEAGNDYYALKNELDARENAESELDLYRAEQSEQRGM